MFIFIVRSAVSAPIHLRTYDQHRLTAWLARHVARCTPGAIINLDNSGLGISRTDCGPLRCANGVGMVRTEPTIPSTVFQNFIILPWLGPWPGPDTAHTYWYRDRKVFVAATGASDARGEVHIRGCRQFPHSVHIGRRTCEYAWMWRRMNVGFWVCGALSITHTHTHTHIYMCVCVCVCVMLNAPQTQNPTFIRRHIQAYSQVLRPICTLCGNCRQPRICTSPRASLAPVAATNTFRSRYQYVWAVSGPGHGPSQGRIMKF